MSSQSQGKALHAQSKLGVIAVVKMQITPAIPSCIAALAGEQGILMRVIKNPTQPGFNHYLFESVAALVKQGCAKDPKMVDKLEEMLIPPFNYVLSQDVQVNSMFAAGTCDSRLVAEHTVSLTELCNHADLPSMLRTVHVQTQRLCLPADMAGCY